MQDLHKHKPPKAHLFCLQPLQDAVVLGQDLAVGLLGCGKLRRALPACVCVSVLVCCQWVCWVLRVRQTQEQKGLVAVCLSTHSTREPQQAVVRDTQNDSRVQAAACGLPDDRV